MEAPAQWHSAEKALWVSGASAIFCVFVTWGSSLRAADTNRLNKPTQKAGSVLRVELDPLHIAVERKMLLKNSYSSWTTSTTYYIVLWFSRGSRLARDLEWRGAPLNTTEGPSILWPSSYTIPSLPANLHQCIAVELLLIHCWPILHFSFGLPFHINLLLNLHLWASTLILSHTFLFIFGTVICMFLFTFKPVYTSFPIEF